MRRYLYNSTEPTVSEEIFDIGSKYLRDGKVKYISNKNGEQISSPLGKEDAEKWLNSRADVRGNKISETETQ